jgi:hypothetical protein
LPSAVPSAAALRAASVHQAAGAALAAVSTTGIAKGIYRFKSHADMNRQTEEALARAVAANIAASSRATDR